MKGWFGGKQATTRGQDTEREAGHYLYNNGLHIVQRNYRCRLGEIDIIARDKTHLVFVEVRLRRNNRYGSGAESVNAAKQRRLLATARHYLSSGAGRELPCRFDVLEATTSPAGALHFNWIKNAFQE